MLNAGWTTVTSPRSVIMYRNGSVLDQCYSLRFIYCTFNVSKHQQKHDSPSSHSLKINLFDAYVISVWLENVSFNCQKNKKWLITTLPENSSWNRCQTHPAGFIVYSGDLVYLFVRKQSLWFICLAMKKLFWFYS